MSNIELVADHYEQIFIGNFDTGKKQVIGPKPPANCRFCNREASKVTFKKLAHSIPELLGNRQLVSTDECDDCNQYFANHVENDLGKFTKPYRLMGQVRGKKSVPSYKTFKGLSRIDFKAGTGFEISEREDDVIHEFDEEKKQVIFHFMREAYCPAAAYKALVKAAISVMPEAELDNFQHAKKWLLCSDHTKPLMQPLKLLMYFVPGSKPHKGTSALLLRKKPDSDREDLPYCLFVVAFGNLQYQVVVPALQDNRGTDNVNFTIPRFPSAFGKEWPYGAPKAATIDMTSGENSAPEPCSVAMHYDEVINNES